MIALSWLRGLVTHRRGRLAAAAAGVAIAVALLGSIGAFLSSSRATMTTRAIGDVAVDWQVEAQSGAEPGALLEAVRADPVVMTATEVSFATTTGLQATTGGSTQTTGPGLILGLPDGYRASFPGEIRDLSGAPSGVLVAQQTAANLRVAPGDTIMIGRSGLAPVPVRVDGVIDLPQADSLFQDVGAVPQAQPQAPPDNVILLPAGRWHDLFDPLAMVRPDQVYTQIHANIAHDLPPDPAAAFDQVAGQARHLEAQLAGRGLVGDNVGATLDAARSDALYAQVLFLFLGLPGAVLAGLLTVTVAGTGRQRRRREQGLLRARGATTRHLIGLGMAEAGVVSILGAGVGLAVAAAVGRVAFGTGGFGATGASALQWAAGSALVGAGISMAAIGIPTWRDARTESVATARRRVRSLDAPRKIRFGLDLVLLGAAGLVSWLTSRNGYMLVLAPEGVATISVSYWAFVGPALAWSGLGLLAWRAADTLLRRGRSIVSVLVRPVSGRLSNTVAASMSRQRHILCRAVVLVALTTSFAASTAIFNATYGQQAEIDARLTNGADVTVTESPGVVVGPDYASTLAGVPGVVAVEPLQHRYAYVGADLQDLYGVRTDTIVGATKVQDAYLVGGSADELMGTLATKPDSILVSLETVRDFQLTPGDPITLRLQDGRTKQFSDVAFHYVGVAKEFPTAPSDSFLVANADYIAQATASPAVGSFLLDTGGADPADVAARVRQVVGTDASVSDITTSRHVIGSSLTAVDLAGLTRVELGFALVLTAASTGLVLALGLAERRRSFAIAAALGATPRQLGSFIWAESAFVTAGGIIAGVVGSWALTVMLVKVLTGVFDPPPSSLAIPWTYLAEVAAVAMAAIALASVSAARLLSRQTPAVIRQQ